MNKELKKKTILLIVVTSILLVGVPLFLAYGDDYFSEKTPTQKATELLQNGIDTSNSLFTSGENRSFEEEVRIAVEEFNQGKTLTAEEALEIARLLDDVKDNEKALTMYDIALDLGSGDFLILVDKGDIYSEMGLYELAAQQYELAKIKFPSIYEIYIGQANAYKQISDTPQYLIDDIYRQGIAQIPGQYELYEAFIDWLEDTDRERETIQYYEVINRINPQDLLEQRINELKTKYPSE